MNNAIASVFYTQILLLTCDRKTCHESRLSNYVSLKLRIMRDEQKTERKCTDVACLLSLAIFYLILVKKFAFPFITNIKKFLLFSVF